MQKKTNIVDALGWKFQRKVTAEDYDKVWYDGSTDDKINPEGLKNYIVQPPLPITGPAEVPACVLPALASHKEVNNENITENFEQQLDNDTAKGHYGTDRDYTHEFFGRKLKVFYENGFFVGAISWYNRERLYFFRRH